MKTLKKLLIALIVLLFSFGTASAFVAVEKDAKDAFYQTPIYLKAAQEQRFGLVTPKIIEQLALTAKQQAQLIANYQQNRVAQRLDSLTYRNKMATSVVKHRLDKKAADSLLAERQKMHGFYALKRRERQFQLLAILTLEQKAKYIRLLKERAKPAKAIVVADKG